MRQSAHVSLADACKLCCRWNRPGASHRLWTGPRYRSWLGRSGLDECKQPLCRLAVGEWHTACYWWLAHTPVSLLPVQLNSDGVVHCSYAFVDNTWKLMCYIRPMYYIHLDKHRLTTCLAHTVTATVTYWLQPSTAARYVLATLRARQWPAVVTQGVSCQHEIACQQ